jgi:hypothetical protein
MKRIYGFISTLYLNNIFVISLDIFIVIAATKIMTNHEETDNLPISSYFGIIFIIWGIWFLIFAIMSILNIVNAIKKFMQKDVVLLEKCTKVLKLTLIPFWIINFIGYTVLVIMINIPSHGFGVFIIPIPIIASYCVLIITSIYSILLLLLLFQNKKLNNKQFLVYIIMQLCFVLDIISIIYFFRKKRKLEI